MKNNKNLDVPKIVIVGHVDHGKSSFIGRFLYDIGEIQEEKYRELKKASQKRRSSTFYSQLVFLLLFSG